MRRPTNNALHLVEATAADLDRIMELERQGFAAGHQELRSTYAQRIAAFPRGSLMAWRGTDCVGCVFSEIWRDNAPLNAEQFTLGHDIHERHAPTDGTALYISSMTLAPSVRGQGLGAPLLLGCLDYVAQAFPRLETAVLLVNAGWAPARRIYAGVGFVEVSRFTGFFDAGDGSHQDGIVMCRPILIFSSNCDVPGCE